MDLEEEVERRRVKFYIPNWFSVEIKTGVSLKGVSKVNLLHKGNAIFSLPSSPPSKPLTCLSSLLSLDVDHSSGGV